MVRYSRQLILRGRTAFPFRFLQDMFLNVRHQRCEKAVIKDSCDTAAWIWKTQMRLCSVEKAFLKSGQRMLTSEPPPKHFSFYRSQPKRGARFRYRLNSTAPSLSNWCRWLFRRQKQAGERVTEGRWGRNNRRDVDAGKKKQKKQAEAETRERNERWCQLLNLHGKKNTETKGKSMQSKAGMLSRQMADCDSRG